MLLFVLSILAIVGIGDSGYLSYERLSGNIPPCSTNPLVDCGKVLKSEYSTLFGVPLSVLGLFHYSIFLGVVALVYKFKAKLWRNIMLIQAIFGVLFSVYLVYIQLGILKAICLYCMLSAINSFIIVLIALWAYKTYEHTQKTVKKE